MKKLRQLLTALLLLCSVVANAAVSDFEVDGIGYSITSSIGKTVEITYYISYNESVVIPESVTYNGVTYSVTSIFEYAFAWCDALTSVTIGNSVTSIGKYAFYDCDALASVEIGHSVKYIGEGAFSRCSSLKTFFNFSTKLSLEASGNIVVYNLPKGSKEGDYIFGKLDNVYTLRYYLGNDTDLILPENCNGENYVISEKIFADNGTIKSVVIPNSVTSIGNYAFSGCSGLTSITIGNSVTSIGERAFLYCNRLTSITIPNSVTSIGESVFYGCSGLTSITIPNSVTSIGYEAFCKCYNLTSVTIGNSVTSIGHNVFYECSRLKSITIPNSVTSIGNAAFYGCSGLTSITIPNSVTSIGSGTFNRCTGLKTVFNFSNLNIIKGSTDYGYVAYYANKVYNPVSKFSNDELYYISQPRHSGGTTSWAVEQGGAALKSNNDLGFETAVTDSRQHFAILSGNGGATYYLYHAAEKKFVNKDGSLGTAPVDAICITAGAYENTFIFYFDSDHYINVGGSKQMTIDWWSTPDGGNSCLIVPVDTFDPTEVLKNFNGNVEITGISLSHTNSTLIEGESFTLTATITPSNATDNTVVWTTSNNAVATVENGVVTAVAPGTATITARAGDYSASCEVTVKAIYIAVTGISLNHTNSTLIEGESFTLTATITPSNATDNTVVWTTSNSAVATVENGVVTAVAPGTATITARAGDYSASCDVTVEKKKVVITAVSQLSNDQLYHISQPRHSGGATSWAVGQGGAALKSNNDLGIETSETDSRQHFAILSNDGGATYYLYHAAEKKFVNKDGSLGTEPVDVINIIAGAYENTFLFYFDSDHYINVGGSKQMLINDWRTPDGGNSCSLVSVGAFDPAEALEKFNIPEDTGIRTIYYISTPRGSWAVETGDNVIKSNSDLGIVAEQNDVRQQFAVLSIDEETYYLYHPSEKKFVNKDGSLSATPADAIYFKDGKFEDTYVVYFDDTRYINLGGSHQMLIDGWSTPDEGNSCTFVPVGTFDAKTALAAINKFETAIEDVECEEKETVIYDLQGRRIKEITASGIYIINGKKTIVR